MDRVATLGLVFRLGPGTGSVLGLSWARELADSDVAQLVDFSLLRVDCLYERLGEQLGTPVALA